MAELFLRCGRRACCVRVWWSRAVQFRQARKKKARHRDDGREGPKQEKGWERMLLLAGLLLLHYSF